MKKTMLASVQQSIVVLVIIGAIVVGILAGLNDGQGTTQQILPQGNIQFADDPPSIALDDSEALDQLGISAVSLEASGTIESTGLHRFTSYDELKEFIGAGNSVWLPYYRWSPYWYYPPGIGINPPFCSSWDLDADTGSVQVFGESLETVTDFSQTNVQVEGIDEADIVKTDGKYIYIAKQNRIIIVEAHPAEEARVLCELELEGDLQSLYISEDRLVVFENVFCDKTWEATIEEDNLEVEMAIPLHPYKTSVKVYDVTDRQEPILDHDVMVDGMYWNSRMVDNYVYVVVKEPPCSWEEEILLPKIRFGDTLLEVPLTEVLHAEKSDSSYQFATIVALDVNKGLEDTQALGYGIFLLESSTNMYVSPEDIYLTCAGYESDSNSWKTNVHRIHIDDGEMKYEATG